MSLRDLIFSQSQSTTLEADDCFQYQTEQVQSQQQDLQQPEKLGRRTQVHFSKVPLRSKRKFLESEYADSPTVRYQKSSAPWKSVTRVHYNN